MNTTHLIYIPFALSYLLVTYPVGHWNDNFTPAVARRAFSDPANIYLFKVYNRNTRKRCEICLKLTIKTPEGCHWLNSSVFIVNFENTSHLFLVFLLNTVFLQCFYSIDFKIYLFAGESSIFFSCLESHFRQPLHSTSFLNVCRTSKQRQRRRIDVL